MHHRPARTTLIVCFALLLLLVLAFFVWYLHPPGIVQEHGTIAITMCPECEQTFLTLLRGGGDITCALYDYSPEVEAALRAAKARVITDDEDGGEYGRQIKQDGLMHNKFCVINGTTVTSGSYNPTTEGKRSRNNLLVIQSPTLARNYLAQYTAIATSNRRERIAPVVDLDGIRVQNAFCPQDSCEAQVNAILTKAQHEILFFHYTLTSEPIAKTLEAAAARGVHVEGVCDGGQWNVQGGKCARLHAQSWDLPYLLHHKVFIVDRITVVTGSYNPTNAGTARNSENILIITDPAIAAQYRSEYDRLRSESHPR